jgi:hypothetical protein
MNKDQEEKLSLFILYNLDVVDINIIEELYK